MRKRGCKWGLRGPRDPAPRGRGRGFGGGQGGPPQGQAPPRAGSHTGAGCFRFPPPRPGARPDPPGQRWGPSTAPWPPLKLSPSGGHPKTPPAAQLGRAPCTPGGGGGTANTPSLPLKAVGLGYPFLQPWLDPRHPACAPQTPPWRRGRAHTQPRAPMGDPPTPPTPQFPATTSAAPLHGGGLSRSQPQAPADPNSPGEAKAGPPKVPPQELRIRDSTKAGSSVPSPEPWLRSGDKNSVK